jgi:hypothetical protein
MILEILNVYSILMNLLLMQLIQGYSALIFQEVLHSGSFIQILPEDSIQEEQQQKQEHLLLLTFPAIIIRISLFSIKIPSLLSD